MARTKKKSGKQIKEVKGAVALEPVLGHVLKEGEERSVDVQIDESVTFSDLGLKDEVVRGLELAGFIRPSPVQLQAIPLAILGTDLIIQAKSGTGKTCVFAVQALETVVNFLNSLRVLIISPVREVAIQIGMVIESLGKCIEKLQVDVAIGGRTIANRYTSHIVVGTPGRLIHLFEEGRIKGDDIQLLVLDEADQLLKSHAVVVDKIIKYLPTNKQVICTSATYSEDLQKMAKDLMRSPNHVTISAEQLVAVKQLAYLVKHTKAGFPSKLDALKEILQSAQFDQCIVFTNSQSKGDRVCDALRKHFPTEILSGSKTQEERTEAFNKLISDGLRVLVATDLAARGLDSANVSLVISLENPHSPYTYQHRVGRAGRFGAPGISVTIANEGDDWLHIKAIATCLKADIKILQKPDLSEADKSTVSLTHLTADQLREWVVGTTKRLSYNTSDYEGQDPFVVWGVDKVQPGPTAKNGVDEEKPSDLVESSTEGSTERTTSPASTTEESSNGSEQSSTSDSQVFRIPVYDDFETISAKDTSANTIAKELKSRLDDESEETVTCPWKDLREKHDPVCLSLVEKYIQHLDNCVKDYNSAKDKLWTDCSVDEGRVFAAMLEGQNKRLYMAKEFKTLRYGDESSAKAADEEFKRHMKAMQANKNTGAIQKTRYPVNKDGSADRNKETDLSTRFALKTPISSTLVSNNKEPSTKKPASQFHGYENVYPGTLHRITTIVSNPGDPNRNLTAKVDAPSLPTEVPSIEEHDEALGKGKVTPLKNYTQYYANLAAMSTSSAPTRCSPNTNNQSVEPDSSDPIRFSPDIRNQMRDCYVLPPSFNRGDDRTVKRQGHLIQRNNTPVSMGDPYYPNAQFHKDRHPNLSKKEEPPATSSRKEHRDQPTHSRKTNQSYAYSGADSRGYSDYREGDYAHDDYTSESHYYEDINPLPLYSKDCKAPAVKARTEVKTTQEETYENDAENTDPRNDRSQKTVHARRGRFAPDVNYHICYNTLPFNDSSNFNNGCPNRRCCNRNNNGCCNRSNNGCCNRSNNGCCNRSNNGCCNRSNNSCCNLNNGCCNLNNGCCNRNNSHGCCNRSSCCRSTCCESSCHRNNGCCCSNNNSSSDRRSHDEFRAMDEYVRSMGQASRRASASQGQRKGD